MCRSVVQSISGCLSHRRKTSKQTDQSNAPYMNDPLVHTSPHLHSNSDVLMTIQPPSSVNGLCRLCVYPQRLSNAPYLPPPLPAAFFVRPFYKLLLNKKVTLHDVEACDPEFYNSTKYILDNDPEPLCLTFSVTRECLGEVSVSIGIVAIVIEIVAVVTG